MNFNHRTLAYAILRVTIGFVFLFYGVGKFVGGVTQFAESLKKNFAPTWLPSPAVHLFGLALPFLEVITGLLLVLGFFTRFAIALGGILMIFLTVGMAISRDAATVAHNLIYAIIFFLLLYCVEENGFSLDKK